MWHQTSAVVHLERVFPNAVSFIVAHTNSLLSKYVWEQYDHTWWRDALYSDENMKRYEQVLERLKNFCADNQIRLVVVMTPNRNEERIKRNYETVLPIFEKLGIEYLNLFPDVNEKLGHLNKRALWANPADGHPGPKLTSLYAKEVFEYLKLNGILK